MRETLDYVETNCCACQTRFRVRPSRAMDIGVNTGHATCPQCSTYLHVEARAGGLAWCERWTDYLQRTNGQELGVLVQLMRPVETVQRTESSDRH